MASEIKYGVNEDYLAIYIQDALSRLLNTQRLEGPLLSLNENFVQDFQTILEHVPPEKVSYIYDCIIKCSNDETRFFS